MGVFPDGSPVNSTDRFHGPNTGLFGQGLETQTYDEDVEIFEDYVDPASLAAGELGRRALIAVNDPETLN